MAVDPGRLDFRAVWHFVLMQPAAGMMAMLWVLATYAVVFGVLMVILAFKVRRAF